MSVSGAAAAGRCLFGRGRAQHSRAPGQPSSNTKRKNRMTNTKFLNVDPHFMPLPCFSSAHVPPACRAVPPFCARRQPAQLLQPAAAPPPFCFCPPFLSVCVCVCVDHLYRFQCLLAPVCKIHLSGRGAACRAVSCLQWRRAGGLDGRTRGFHLPPRRAARCLACNSPHRPGSVPAACECGRGCGEFVHNGGVVEVVPPGSARVLLCDSSFHPIGPFSSSIGNPGALLRPARNLKWLFAGGTTSRGGRSRRSAHTAGRREGGEGFPKQHERSSGPEALQPPAALPPVQPRRRAPCGHLWRPHCDS